MLDIDLIRKDFRFFDDPEIAYFDNSATSQRPECVARAITEFESYNNANPFRGLYDLSVRATDIYESARADVSKFINAESPEEIIFTRNTSESLNLAAYSLSEMITDNGDRFLKPGDEIITTVMEHHSNLLPWQHAAERTGAKVKYLYPKPDGSISFDDYKELLSGRVKIVAMTHMSNIFGRLIDIKAFSDEAHKYGAIFVCDGAQSVPHVKTDVQDLGVDLMAFSGHKMLGPMGIGVLYGRRDILDKMPPFMTGGEMIEHVSLDEVTYAAVPHKFEAGTVNAEGAAGLSAAIHYINEIGFSEMEERELMLTKAAMDGIGNVPHVSILGSESPGDHHGIITFTIDGVHPHDISAIMADMGVAVRAGHHCAEPLHQYLGIPSTTRASIMFYNTMEEVDMLVRAIADVRPMMGYKD